MQDKSPEDFDIERHLAGLAPPSIPVEVWNRKNINIYAVRNWKRGPATAMLSGLLTEPNLHANGIRIDWLQRLVLSKAIGDKKPQVAEISRALNAGLFAGRVFRLEDPIEDLFCDFIATKRGNFRILTGQWESAGPYTQTLLNAFEQLPPTPQKDSALESVYAILRLSEELARRSGVERLTLSGGNPQAEIQVPDAETLQRLAARVKFSDADLTSLGIERRQLSPFMLESSQLPYIAETEPGDGPLDLHPLLEAGSEIMVASPPGISLAVRAVLVNVAKRESAANLLLSHLLEKQERHAEGSGFWPTGATALGDPDRHFLRTSVMQSASGRYLQIIQIPVTFDQFPQKAFGSVRRMSDEVGAEVAKQVAEFWNHLSLQINVRESTTFLLLSGWGTPHSIAPPIDHARRPPGWRFMSASFADVASLGACENGNFHSARRIVEQVEKLEEDGFSFQNLNGLLNMFGFWRSTKGHLIPEHMHDMRPPCNLVLPTDEVLPPRIEAAKKRDYRSLPFPDGTYRIVLLEDWDSLQPIYGSIKDLEQGRLTGAACIEGRTWWIVEESPLPKEWRYRIWQAVLRWMTAVGPAVIQSFPAAFPKLPTVAAIQAPPFDAYETLRDQGRDIGDLVSSVRFLPGASIPVVQLMPEWVGHVNSRENHAEVEFVAAVLFALQAPGPGLVSRDALREVVRTAIGSTDWRWLHAQEAFTPLERMARSSLFERFREIPLAAFSLAKCRSVWEFRGREEGTEISGEENCRKFLAQYKEHILGKLVSRIRSFDRQHLVLAAASRYQSARYEQGRWRLAIRAMRAIHGESASESAFKRQNSINAVQRAAKSVMEIAACEGLEASGVVPDEQDLDDLFALALLLFGNGQLFASIRAGLVEPVLRISPAGDLLSDRSAIETALTPAARISTEKTLNEASEEYGQGRPKGEHAADGSIPIEDAFRRALEAEYGTSAEAFVDLQFAVLQLAEAQNSGQFAMKRSELAKALHANKNYPSQDVELLLSRLTLGWRSAWGDLPPGTSESDFDLGRFDRRHSLINRPLLALEAGVDPLVLIAPVVVSDSTMYALSGLSEGHLQNQFWTSEEARRYAGLRTNEVGHAFERRVAARLRELGLKAWTRVKLSWILNMQVDPALGDIDVLAISADNRRVWVIEAKDLRFCRTEAEVSARLSEYRGRMVRDDSGRERPDKMLRHIRRVQFLRQHNTHARGRLGMKDAPEIRALLVVDSPQPMNFYMLDQLDDGKSAFLDAIGTFKF